MTRTAVVLALASACKPDAPSAVPATAPPPVVATPAPAPTPEPAGPDVPRTGFDAEAARSSRNVVLQVEQLVEQFRVAKRGQCPADVAELKSAGFSARVVVDGWGRPPLILCQSGPAPVVVISAGPDGAFGSHDDIRSSDTPSER